MANSALSFLPFLVLYSAFPQPATSYNNQTDLLSLLAFKSALQDPFQSLISWKQTTHFCNWTGIRCGGHRHQDRVVGIALKSRGLVGSLSPHVGNLSFLRIIDLQNNTFHGPITQEISLLKRLEVVEFSNNSFTGAIPYNWSRSLVYLNLIDNELSGIIPIELSSLFKLEALGLSSNKLSGANFLQSIGNLTSLMLLSLRSCSLIGEIPASTSRLERLILFQLSENNLTGTIPSALFNLSDLHIFQVSENQLQGPISSTLGLAFPRLERFDVADNQIHGPIPASMLNASSLEYLDLDENYFTGPVPTFGRLANLHTVLFSSNRIEDDIKFISTLINSTNLKFLNIRDNLLTGSLPDSIANFSSQLSRLYIGMNKVQGKIPPGIDELPSSFGNLSSLNELYIFDNKFSGNLPPSIGNCTNLLFLDIFNNSFKGVIPPEIMSISSLSIMMDMSMNLFEGSIPNEVGSLRNLGKLDLSYNRLSGPIPDSLSQCVSLEILDLSGNFFEGQIPSSLSSLAGLRILNFSQNNLSGPVPTFLGKLNLQYLNLSFNKLQGEVPTTGIFENETLFSLDGNKELCGGILALKLHPCPRPHSNNKNLSSLLKMFIPIIGTGGIIVFVVIMYKKRMCLKNVSPYLSSFTGVQIMRLSYADILKATAGFSENNLLGFGRFGSVYKGILEDGQTMIAVKVLNLSVRGASRSFIAECTTLRNVRHRNLLKILSVCESIDFQGNDFKALVYELKVNGSLEKWLHQSEQNANLTQRVNIVVDIAEGIEYLHSGTGSCIVHGDLKPSNILLDQDMTACVGDFGLSKFILDAIPFHESNSSIGVRGTIGYVPPEYGMSCPVSIQGDAYSYGIVLLEMFTNKRPTDDLPGDHVNLHCFVSAALPDRVMEVVDPQFQTHDDKIKDCLASILTIGVYCSKEIPRERMSMTNAVNELRKIQKLLSRTR